MNESLQSARNIHQILIVVCTIIGVFAISVRPTKNRFDQALKELRTLEAVLDSVNIERVNYIKKTLTDSNSRFANAQLRSKIEFQDKTSYSYKTLQVFKRELVLAWYMADSVTVINATDTKAIEFSTRDSPLTIDFEGTPVVVHPPDDRWLNTTKYIRRLSYKYRLAKNGLLPNPDEPSSAFPKLTAIWEFVKDQNFDQAKVVLQNKVDQTTTDKGSEIDVAGLKVAGEFMYIAGPFIAFILTLYLKMLIDHINILATTERKELTTFPWMILFTSPLSRAVSITSIYAYPLLVSFGIVTASGLTQTEKYYWLTGYGVIFGILLIFMSRSIKQLLRLVRDKGFF